MAGASPRGPPRAAESMARRTNPAKETSPCFEAARLALERTAAGTKTLGMVADFTDPTVTPRPTPGKQTACYPLTLPIDPTMTPTMEAPMEDHDTIHAPAETAAPVERPQTLTMHGDDESVGRLLSAIAEAQAGFEQPKMTKHVTVRMKTGGSYDFDYAPLQEILRCVRPALARAGVALLQPITTPKPGVYELRTVLAGHGGMLVAKLPFRLETDDPKALGSQITYLRRYSVSAMLCVAADDDDDAGAATGDETQPRQAPRAERRRGPKAESKPAQEPAQAPQEGGTERASQVTMKRLVEAFSAAGVSGMARGKLAMDVTGVGLDAVTEQGAQAILAKLAEMGGA